MMGGKREWWETLQAQLERYNDGLAYEMTTHEMFVELMRQRHATQSYEDSNRLGLRSRAEVEMSRELLWAVRVRNNRAVVVRMRNERPVDDTEFRRSQQLVWALESLNAIQIQNDTALLFRKAQKLAEAIRVRNKLAPGTIGFGIADWRVRKLKSSFPVVSFL